MDPVSIGVMGAISIGTSIVGAGVSAYGAKSKANAEATMQRLQANAQARQYEASANMSDYQKQVAENNAEIARQNAAYELNAGGVRAENQLLKTGTMIASQKAGFAAGGIDVGSGSVKAVARSTQMLGDLDAMTIVNNANRKAYGYQVDAYNFMNDATLKALSAGYSRDAANIARTTGATAAGATEVAGNIAMTSALIGGASSVSDKWLSMSDKGTFNAFKT